MSYQSIGVVGAGLLGHAIAMVHAMGGATVNVFDAAPERLDWAKGRVQQLALELQELGLLDASEASAALARVHFQENLISAVESADLVIEAIIEDADAKRRLYEVLNPIMPADAVLASNTSFLDIFELVPPARLSKTMIVHWYTPPYLIDLVDVVPSEAMSETDAERMMSFLKGLGKRPVRLKKFVPGYIANNVQMAIESEVFRLLDSGIADAAAIDEAVRFGLAQRLCLMGQLKKIDYTGLQVVHDIHAEEVYQPPSLPTVSTKLKGQLAEGKSGVLSGAGFYDYNDVEAEDYFKRRDRKLARLRSHLLENENDDPL